MVTEACNCPLGLGLHHDHVLDFGPWIEEWTSTFPSMLLSRRRAEKVNDRWEAGTISCGVPTEDIRVCIDWEKVARAVMTEDDGNLQPVAAPLH